MERNKSIDKDKAIEIADRIWWVGSYLPEESFQCHVYLIEQGDNSVLLDPGSNITFSDTLKKIETVTPFTNIRYFICHHQDPDITSSLTTIDNMITREDAYIVSHWRAEALIKHYDLKTPFWLIEENNWKLDLGGRLLNFIFTPYLHFPGAFCTFDNESGVLFSSDLFGGFTEDFQLYANDEGYFESLRPFHEHYMPSRELLQYSLNKIQEYPVNLIAPQHGSIIEKWLIGTMIEKLTGLECGLFLMARKDVDIKRLSLFNKTLRAISNSMIIYRDFRIIANSLLQNIRNIISSAKDIEFIAIHEDMKLLFNKESRYRGKPQLEPTMYDSYLNIDIKTWDSRFEEHYLYVENERGRALLIPLFSPDRQVINALAILSLSREIDNKTELKQLMSQISAPLQVALEREVTFHIIEEERQKYFEKSIKCPLTKLFTRVYMYDIVQRMFDVHNRNEDAKIGLALLDIDFFKKINDTFGHNIGDVVLKRVAGIILDNSRTSDFPVRFGGEEFAVFIVESKSDETLNYAEKIRRKVSETVFDKPMESVGVTISSGVTLHIQGETLEETIERADVALYKAKQSGRNKVCAD